MATEFEEGLMVGLLIGDGHFGGDGRQPQVTLRMHTRHSALMRWIERTFPGGRVYGPYHHSGRDYLQWMARGAYLRDVLGPILQRRLFPGLDGYTWERFVRMMTTYGRQLASTPQAGEVQADPPPSPEHGRSAGIFPASGPEVDSIEELFKRIRLGQDTDHTA